MDIASRLILAWMLAFCLLPGSALAQQPYVPQRPASRAATVNQGFILPVPGGMATGRPTRRTSGGIPVSDGAAPVGWNAPGPGGPMATSAATGRWAYQPQPAPPSPLMQPTPADPLEMPAWPQEMPPGEAIEAPEEPIAESEFENVMPWAENGFEMYDDGWYGDGYFDGECHACFPFYPDVDGVWLTDFMATALYRNSARNVLLSRDLEGIEAIDVLTTKNISFTVAPGLAVNVQRYLGTDASDNRYTLDFVYTGLYNWDETAVVTGGRVDVGAFSFGSLLSNFVADVGGFSRADLQRIHYKSQLNNVEVNLVLSQPTTRPRLAYRAGKGWVNEPPQGFNRSLIGGLRLIVLDETFRFFSIGEATFNGAPLGVSTGDYRVESRNRMLGMQIGALIDQRRTNAQWGVRAVLGPYINMMREQSALVINAENDPFATPIPNRFTRNTDERVAFVGQLGVFGRYRLLPYLSLAVGYDFMWINGLALAPEQLNFDTDRTLPLNTHGHLFFQGARLGAEMIW